MSKLTTAQILKIKEVTNGDIQQAQLLQSSCESEVKDVTTAYIIGALFGGLGAHRIYAGQIGLGIFQFITVCFVIGFFWVLADVFLTKGLIEDVNDKIVDEKIAQFKVMSSGSNSSGEKVVHEEVVA